MMLNLSKWFVSKDLYWRSMAVSCLRLTTPLFWLCLVLVMLAGSGCTTIRKNYPRPESLTWPKPEETSLGRKYAPEQARHTNQSGFYLLSTGMDAFLARAYLADKAERTIDVQYYIVHGDLTGKLLMYHLLKAADRGVHVRLLLDDHHTGGRDFEMAAIDAHPNIEVRLFNPYMGRHVVMISRPVDFMIHPSRLNRRMHNKVFAVDNAAAIVGGRNLGDEYFEASDDMEFHDMDLLAVGPIVKQVSTCFDDYWNSEWAVPIGALRSSKPTASDFADSCHELREFYEASRQTPYSAALRDSDFMNVLSRDRLRLIWASSQVFCDPPSKIAGLNKQYFLRYMHSQLEPIANRTDKELLLISPYFVPGDEGMEFFHRLRSKNVRVRILSNSLASNDSPIVHVGYTRYRKALVQSGVELYEYKPSAELIRRTKRKHARLSKWASLHTKAFVFDRRTVFIGSLNLDPRSLRLNTEMGLIVDSPELAGQVAALFNDAVQPKNSYQIGLETLPADPIHDIPARSIVVWHTTENGKPVQYSFDPRAACWRQMLTILLSLMPLEDQL
jgi:putative cardiolipin synthase